MDKISLIYLINLSRRPDRYEHFIKQCDEQNINFNKIKRFNALDGKIYNFTDDEKELFTIDAFNCISLSNIKRSNIFFISEFSFLSFLIEFSFEEYLLFLFLLSLFIFLLIPKMDMMESILIVMMTNQRQIY